MATRAAAISFRLFLAFFPAVIFLLSVLPHTPLETEAVMDALLLLFPGDTVGLFQQTVEDLLGKTQGALLSVGFVLTLYYASSSVHAVLSGFNESALLDQKGNPWLMRIWSMFLLVLLVVLLGVAVLLIGFSGDVLQWASKPGLVAWRIAEVVQPCPLDWGHCTHLQHGHPALQCGTLGSLEVEDSHSGAVMTTF